MNDDGIYTPEEETLMDRYEERALDVYVQGMALLREWAPDLHDVALALEPVNLVPYPDVPVAAAGYVDDGELGLVVNVAAFAALSAEEAAFIVAHEAEHIRREHHLLEKLDGEARRRRGYAQDVVINEHLLARGLPRPPQPTLPSSALIGHDCRGLDWPEVLDLLPDHLASDPGYYRRRLEPDQSERRESRARQAGQAQGVEA